MFTIHFVSVIFSIGILFLIETKQHSIVSPANDCIDAMCIDNEPINDSGTSVRNRRLSDKSLVSKLIRDDEFVMQASSSDRCRNTEQWNGNECIPLISVCPEDYHWNGYTCVIQMVTKTAALVPSGPDTKCARNAKINSQPGDSDAVHRQSLPMTVMPTYSTSPMCPFGFVWSNDKCMHNPPTCPGQYVFHENLCHLRLSSTSNTIETIRQPLYGNNLNGNSWRTTQPTNIDFKQNPKQEIENSAVESSTDYDRNHKNCCIIRSARLCRRKIYKRKEQWQCYHHQYRRCGGICTKPNLFVRPKKTVFVDPLLIMPPLPRRLQKFMLNLPYRESNIGKQSNRFTLCC